jgi:hypothetical protein
MEHVHARLRRAASSSWATLAAADLASAAPIDLIEWYRP